MKDKICQSCDMSNIRRAMVGDASRIAEILVFTKRICYRSIFNDDKFAFGEMQVLPLAQNYIENPKLLENIWLYDDGFVKAMINIDEHEVKELYVDYLFQDRGIGEKLLEFAIYKFDVTFLWTLEKNVKAIKFYKNFGFDLTGETAVELGTAELNVKMVRK